MGPSISKLGPGLQLKPKTKAMGKPKASILSINLGRGSNLSPRHHHHHILGLGSNLSPRSRPTWASPRAPNFLTVHLSSRAPSAPPAASLVATFKLFFFTLPGRPPPRGLVRSRHASGSPSSPRMRALADGRNGRMVSERCPRVWERRA